jgi:colicin import membrane protein
MTARPHLEFAPPPAPGSVRAMGLAILAHAVLLAILSVGVQWKSDPTEQRFEAELWGAVPVEAAPPAPLPEPEPPKPAPPEVKPEPKPAPPAPTAAELKAEADIALAKEKEKQLKEKKLAQEKLDLEKKKLAELEKKKQAELEKQKQAKLELEKQKQSKLEQEKKDKEKLAAEKDKQKRVQDQKDAKQMEDDRQKIIKRMAGLAGAGGSGAATSTSTALEARSLSTSYAGRIRSYIKRFLTYTETISGNPTTEIEVRLASDGSILSRRVTKASGTKSWDDAALNAIDKAEKLPLDENGRAPSPMTIIWSAQEVTR